MRESLPILLLFLTSLLLQVSPPASAGPTEKFEGLLGEWVGHQAELLVEVWGYPLNVSEAPNRNRVYVYSQSESVIYGIGSRQLAVPVELACTVYFELDGNNAVLGTRYEGKSKYCWKYFKPHRVPRG